MAKVATCIACGCDDYHACWDELAELPCGWLRVDRGRGMGVCSSCPEHVDRWDADDASEVHADSPCATGIVDQ